MPNKLVVLAGPDEGRVFTLGTEVLLLGRSRATDSHLLDPHVSRVHCQVMPENGGHVLVDFDSAGGTFVNGKQITRHKLKAGDLVRIGTTHMQFVEEQASGVDAAGPAPVPIAAPVAAAAPIATAATVVGRVTKLRTTKTELDRPGAWAEALVGQVFTHYKVGQPLARSHTGYVFHATDTRRNLPLALKVLDPRYTKDEKLVKRFVTAMKAVLPMRHANLIRVYSAGRSNEHLWVAMEYVKAGESLAAVIGRSAHAGKADWRVVVRLGVYLARALEYAHQKKIIHQNVTPQNVILGRQLPETKLVDLMLASAIYEDPTAPISAAGTPSEALPYMSPERTDGPEGMVDARTDIYSLAATLHAVLSGHPPFQADTVAELIDKIRLDAAPSLQTAAAGAPAGLEPILRRALAKRPQDRQPSAKHFLKDLEGIAKAHNISLGPDKVADVAETR
jgi:pSer/pThr/pTyr-binding forkhead associated (FHA) protein